MEGAVVKEIAGLAQKAVGTTMMKLDTEQLLVHDGKIIERREVDIHRPAVLSLHTLTGLAEYMKADLDSLGIDSDAELALHVVSPTVVELISSTDEKFKQRTTHVRVECHNRFAALPSFKFGQMLDSEVMIIGLHALFLEPSTPNADEEVARVTNARNLVLGMLTNIKQGAARTDDDDGISQVVTVTQGISMLQEKKVPNPVTLIPFRTFAEVAQPASEFVFRMKPSTDSDRAAAALFEADGGAWMLEAIQNVAAWLTEQDLKVPVLA